MLPKAELFEFVSYQFKPKKKQVVFHYKTEFKNRLPIFFSETIILPNKIQIDHLPQGLMKKILQNLHIILGISYYKFYCPPKVKIPYSLAKKEADFWRVVYQKGLGEFFYKNKLDPKITPHFPYIKDLKIISYRLEKNDECLVAIGGGKDSVVATELLKENKFYISLFSVQTCRFYRSSSTKSGQKIYSIIQKIIKTANVNSLKIKRVLDEKVFEKHQYKGHIPISAIYGFLGIFTAIIYKYSYFIVSNEHSSNFGNIKYKGLEINHQWSKSFEFEQLFDDYLKNFISPDVHYFSLLRPFHEIVVAKLFASQKKYFPYFSSCNKNFSLTKKINGGLWCTHCPKCVFVFTLLSAFTSKKELLGIFKKNLYQDENLLPFFKDILGFGKMKPFDCIGTFQEAQTAFYLARKKPVLSKAEGFKKDFIVSQIGDKARYDQNVFKMSLQSNIPEQFRFVGIEKVLIVGYGKEGKVTRKYFKKYYPKIKIRIADEKQGRDYLEKQMFFDIAIKTPGIKKELVTIPYTTATNIFFSKVTGKNLIIGVTGSKGKSTTSSLIYEILKKAGKRVELLGNIGKPMLERLLKPLDNKTIFVLELSSAQLEDLKLSPDIAVVTNLFPEHMDYHGSIENYYNAKKNIINFQSKNGYFVYNQKNKKMKKWLADYKGKAIPFSNSIPLKEHEIPLVGEHNKDNIKAAIAAAKILSVLDKVIVNSIKNFKPLPHRLEFVGEFKGIKFYDDAISTTPESTIMAIKSLKSIDTIFLGGRDRGYSFSDLEKTIKKYKINNIVLFPDSGEKILKQVKNFKVFKIRSMEKAVFFAYKNTAQGKICLLSCASPSYSLWKNFEEKGEQFKYFVKKIGKK